MRPLVCATLCGVFLLLDAGVCLQIQCYQCDQRFSDCSSAEFIVNCTANVQDTCQREELITEEGVHYRKSCASSGACLIASSGYQQFCTGRLHSVCISCCGTPLCNGPRRRRTSSTSSSSSSSSSSILRRKGLLLLFLLLLTVLM